MSFDARDMDRGYSAQSLSSRGGSEMGSRYLVESGFYMTSFAATVFIGGLIIVGILLITLLIALTVMLQSCESKSSGVVETSSNHHNCMIYAQHAELNSLGMDSFPSICKDFTIQYIKEGQYSRDLNFIMWIAEDYFNSILPLDDGRDVVMMDIDDIFLPNSHNGSLLFHRYNQFGCNNSDEEANRLRCTLILRLYLKLRAGGWLLILLSRRPEKLRNATVEYLESAGYGGWSSLIMRLDGELQMNNNEYFSKRREKLYVQGYRIAAIISTHMDALTGPFLGNRIFKIPNPIYCSSEHRVSEIRNLLQ